MVDTTLSPPAVLDPPFKDPVVDGAQIMTDLWQAWCTGVSRTPMLLTGGGGHHADRDEHERPGRTDLGDAAGAVHNAHARLSVRRQSGPAARVLQSGDGDRATARRDYGTLRKTRRGHHCPCRCAVHLVRDGRVMR